MIWLSFLLTALAVVLAPRTGVVDTLATAGMSVPGAVFMAMTLAVFLASGAFAAAAREMLPGSAAAMRRPRRGFAGVFAGLGVRLAFERA
jgi:threonine/homoserine/homoserine lactone efflux protein